MSVLNLTQVDLSHNIEREFLVTTELQVSFSLCLPPGATSYGDVGVPRNSATALCYGLSTLNSYSYYVTAGYGCDVDGVTRVCKQTRGGRDCCDSFCV